MTHRSRSLDSRPLDAHSVTAIVPTLGHSRHLPAALRALRADGGAALEIVLVAPRSLTTFSRTTLSQTTKDLADRVLHTDGPLGFAAANNLALASTDRPLVALVNDDAVVELGWLAALLAELDHDPQLAAVQGINLRFTENAEGPSLEGTALERIDGYGIRWNHWLQATQLGHGRALDDAPSESTPIFGVSATAAVYRRAALAVVAREGRGLDERLGSYYEDVDLAGRLRRAGYTARVVPAARARHAGSTTGRRLPLGGAALIHGNRLLVLMDLLGRAFGRHLPRILVREAIDALSALLRGRPREALGVAVGLGRAALRAPGWLHSGAPVPLEVRSETREDRASETSAQPPVEKISAVVVHWRNEAELERLATAWPTDPDLELIVVDNSASLDPDHLHSLPAGTRIETPAGNLGFGGGVARGVAAARFDWILVLNPDIVPLPGAIEALREAIRRHPDTDGFAPALVDPRGGTQHRWQLQPLPSPLRLVVQGLAGGGARGPRRPPLAGTRVEQPAAAAILLRRSTLERVGGLDDGYFPAWFEDVDLAARLRTAGAILRYAPRARFEHAQGATVPALGYGPFLWIYDRHATRYLARHHGLGWARAARAVRALGLTLRIAALAVAKPKRARTRREAFAGLGTALLGVATGWRSPRPWRARFSPPLREVPEERGPSV